MLDNPNRKVKTTIDIPEKLWKAFSIKIIQEYGGRKKNDVIKELLEMYVKGDITLQSERS